MSVARAKLAELRALRAAGKKRLDSYQIEDQGAIYDEVDEEGYKKVVRNRLNQDDFVIDDNGEGYADDGREEWQTERRHYSSDDQDEAPLKGKAAKRKREEDKEQQEKTNHKILNYFNNGPVAAAPKPKVIEKSPWYRLSTETRYRCKRRQTMKLSWQAYLERLTPMPYPHDHTLRKRSNGRRVEKSEFYRPL